MKNKQGTQEENHYRKGAADKVSGVFAFVTCDVPIGELAKGHGKLLPAATACR
ncbi:hypothetical protein D3C80_2215270 [compost metagenome]